MEETVYKISYECVDAKCSYIWSINVHSTDYTMHEYSRCEKCHTRCKAAFIWVLIQYIFQYIIQLFATYW